MKDDAQGAAIPPRDDRVVPIWMPEDTQPVCSERRDAAFDCRPDWKAAVERPFLSPSPPAPTPLPGTTFKTVERKLDRRYLWLWGIRNSFQSPARPPGAAPGCAVRISFDPQGIGTVWVQDPATGRFVEARPVGASAWAYARGRSLDEHLALSKAARARQASALAERATISASTQERIRAIAATPAVRRSNSHWSMDIVVDWLASGRPFQILMLVDTANLTSPAIAVDFAIAGEHIVAVLDRLASEQGLPAIISADNGRLFASRSLAAWAGRRGISLEHPQAARVAFNSRLRRGGPARHRFADLDEARRAIEEWRIAANAAALAARPD